jgi:hypothetical protein
MTAGILTVHESFEVPTITGASGVLHVVDTFRSNAPGRDAFVEDALRPLVDRIATSMQGGRLNSVDLAHHMATDEGYRVAVMDGEPTQPLGFAFLRELPPRKGWHVPGRTTEVSPRDFVIEQFDVTWQPGPGPERRANQPPQVPAHFLRAVDAVLSTIVSEVSPLDNIFVVDHPGERRRPDYFERAGFVPVSEGIKRVMRRNEWGSGKSTLGARAVHIRRTLEAQPAFPRRIQPRPDARPAASA